MRDFIGVCRGVWQIHRGSTLVSEVALENMEIAPGYYLSQWRNEPRNRDAWQFMRRVLQRKAPLSGVLPEAPGDRYAEYRHGGDLVLGLAAAHQMESLAVSLPTAPCWDTHKVTVEFAQVDFGSGSEEEWSDGVVDVRHASAIPHVSEHEEWIRETAEQTVRSGAELWADRATLFPHLQFVPGVEQNLADVSPASLRSVQEELFRLQAAAAAWVPGEAEPPYQVKVVPESESRIREGLCHFPDIDGEERLFSLHVRFNPRPGRIHFRLVTDESTIRVGYIGRKRLRDGVPRRAR